MLFQFNGETMETKGVYSVAYPNELLDGILLDFDDNYTFLSDHVEGHRDFMEEVIDDDEPFDHYDLTDCEPDYDTAPHSWIAKSVGKMIVKTAEKICYEAADEGA